jgi:hypothetical protein
VLYDIYTKGRWLGFLNELIIGLETEVNNTVITSFFGSLRTGCGKRCSYSDVCNVCNRFVSINNTLQEAKQKDETSSNEETV